MLPGRVIEMEQEPALRIELAKLPADMRQPVWAWMQKRLPELCKFLGGPECKLIRETMEAAPVLALDDAEARELLAAFPGISRYSI